MIELPAYFPYPNSWTVFLHRLGLGERISSPDNGAILVLTTLDADTGRKRRTPLHYAWAGYNAVYVMPAHVQSRWFRDLQANAYAELWIGREWWAGRASPVRDPDEWLDAYRRVLQRSGTAVQRLMGINPHTASDGELRARGQNTPILRIQLEHQLVGPGGPGDLKWLLPLALIGVSVLWLIAQRKAEHVV